MSRTYSPKTCLRLTPNALLKAYFAKKGLLGEMEFDKLGEANVMGHRTTGPRQALSL